MRFSWSRKFAQQGNWAPALEGVFYPADDRLYFYYHHMNTARRLALPDCREDKLICSGDRSCGISLPHHWGVFREHGKIYLAFNDRYGCLLENEGQPVMLPESVSRQYKIWCGPDKKLEEQSFRFGAYTIEHKGAFGYTCKVGGRELWTFRGQGYLYTEIIRWKDLIFFGTAGMGGYFYILELKTGNPVLSLKTLGTSFVIHSGNHCYVWQKGKPAKLLRIDLVRGEVCDECPLPGIPTDDSVMFMYRQMIYVSTFVHKNGLLKEAFMNGIDIAGDDLPENPWIGYHKSNGAVLMGEV